MAASLSESRSCSWSDDALGRHGIAVDQPPGGGSNYPLVGPGELSDLVADLYLSYQDPDQDRPRPFRIRWLYGMGCLWSGVPFDPVHSHDALIEDDDGVEVFDSRDGAYWSRAWGSRLRIHQWRTATGVLRLVQHTAWRDGDTPREWPVYLEPDNGRIDDRALEVSLPSVVSIRIEDGTPLSGSLALGAGYNTVWTDSADVSGSRLVTRLELAAEPGSGEGRYEVDCEDNLPPMIRRINGQGPDASGNLILDGLDCVRVWTPIRAAQAGDVRRLDVRAATLAITDDCDPCYTCDDVLRTYEGVRRLRNRYAEIIDRLKTVRDQLTANILRFNQDKDCRLADPLRLVVRPLCPDKVLVAVGYCNGSSECLLDLVLTIDLSDSEYNGGGAPGVVCDSVSRTGVRAGTDRYRLGGTYPYLHAVWDRVDPGGMAQVSFTLEFPGSQAGDYMRASLDAYAPSPAVAADFGADGPPIPGYVVGTGPTTPEALAARLVDEPKIISAGLLQDEFCCEDSSLSEVV